MFRAIVVGLLLIPSLAFGQVKELISTEKLPHVERKHGTVRKPEDNPPQPTSTKCQCKHKCGRDNCQCETSAVAAAACKPAANVPVRRTQCLMFTAPWCAPCKPAKDELKAWLIPNGWDVSAVNDAHFRLVNADENPELMELHGVTDLPTFVFLFDGKPISKTTGYPGKEKLVKEFLDVSKNWSGK